MISDLVLYVRICITYILSEKYARQSYIILILRLNGFDFNLYKLLNHDLYLTRFGNTFSFDLL